MMARRTYDRFMVASKIGTNRKIRRLRPEQRWAHVAGVLALAAESPVPGHLLIAEGVRVNAADIAEHAGVSMGVAEKTLDKLRELGVVRFDADAACEYVHDWDEWNNAPKSDPGAADRMRRYRDRLRNAERNVTGEHARNADNGYGDVRQEVEVEVEGTTTGTSNRSGVPHPHSGSNVVDFAEVERATKDAA